MTDDVRQLEEASVELTDNHVDVSTDIHPPDYRSYAEIQCDCGEWVEFVVGNITVTCDCGETWSIKAVKVDRE